jgi:hypothetical protein
MVPGSIRIACQLCGVGILGLVFLLVLLANGLRGKHEDIQLDIRAFLWHHGIRGTAVLAACEGWVQSASVQCGP